jgi:hypothetical protein
MKKLRFALALLVLVSALPPLISCSHDDKKDKVQDEADKDDKQKTESNIKKNPPICPQVAILRPLQDMRDYGHDTPDLSQLVAAARLENVSGECEYKDNGIDITFDLTMSAVRATRLGGHHASFPYFAAVLDGADTIINKEMFTAEFNFSDDKPNVTSTNSLHVFIPLDKSQLPTGPTYRVLIGFQETKEQAGGK